MANVAEGATVRECARIQLYDPTVSEVLFGVTILFAAFGLARQQPK